MARFSTDTAVRRVAPGTYEAHMDTGWWIQRGPNGGYVAAIVLRAMLDAIGDHEGARHPRSMTLHYLAPPAEGPVTVHISIERSGRSLTTVSARMTQRDPATDQERLLVVALGAFSVSRPSVEFDDGDPPPATPPDLLDEIERPADRPTVPMAERYETRHAVGSPPFAAGGTAHTGGWIRLAEPEPLSSPLVAAYADGWIPALFSRFTEPVAVPTIDLTIHFRRPVPDDYDDWCFVEFRSRAALDGYLDEDGSIWTSDGRLLAQSRQLALLMPL
jgi:acyl-CoA thioesterase